MQEKMESFLATEITEQEFYDGIIDFVTSCNIRSGEYECNEFVIKKMDAYNFIIFQEYEIDEKREIYGSFSIQKNKLIKLITSYARKQRIVLKDN
ncbi:hypothetical protein [Virgibacillus sp. SK37]|uniref:hypothetical protein n=1 Tax=Virgibacillus sp. SK37 TaxID=403957 RepID=UPI0004D18BE1|nr:hypothetical protein [Virgibacillus sp. SK37]AIF43002.1 hypothetical protein X953_07325 [Virgibacillus sp. SK37]